MCSACPRASCWCPTRCRPATRIAPGAASATTSCGIARRTTQALADLCTDATGALHEFSIAPPLIRPEVVSAMKASARALLAPPMADVFEHARQPFFQPIYDLASPQLAIGRVALLGDAAFVARPHVGAGVTKAALDAMCLADAIHAAGDDLTAALADYDRRQRQLGDWCVARGRQMGSRIRLAAAGGARALPRRAGPPSHAEHSGLPRDHRRHRAPHRLATRAGRPPIAAFSPLRLSRRSGYVPVMALLRGGAASDFATSRAHSMKRSTTGLNMRFFSVTITTGHGGLGRSIGRILSG